MRRLKAAILLTVRQKGSVSLKKNKFQIFHKHSTQRFLFLTPFLLKHGGSSGTSKETSEFCSFSSHPFAVKYLTYKSAVPNYFNYMGTMKAVSIAMKWMTTFTA